MTHQLKITFKSTIKISVLVLLTVLTACKANNSSVPEQAPTATTPTAAKTTFEILASYPEGSFLENLEVQADGRLLFTNYFSKTIEQMTPNGEKSTFATVSGYPVSLISIASGYLITAQSKNFMSGEPDNAQLFLLLDKNGTEVGQFDAPGTIFLNGMTRLENGDILVADSVASTIWKVDVETQKVTSWLQHKTLAADPEQPGIPGANGLKLHPKGLVVSNTSQRSLFLIKVDNDGQATGEPEQLSQTGLIDDFWINDDGSIVYTTHGDALKSISSDGTISDVITEGCNGCTAVAPFPLGQSNTFILINDGGFFFGPKQQSTVARVTVK